MNALLFLNATGSTHSFAKAVAQALLTSLSPVAALALSACASARPPNGTLEPVVRWVQPSAAIPHGSAPGAKVRLLATEPDGTQEYVLVLSQGDEALTALSDFARDRHVVAAHFAGIGAVLNAEVGWLDPVQKVYKAMFTAEQTEVLSLVGDMALGSDGAPKVHAHIVLGRSNGHLRGGHLLSATVSPTLEVFVTTFPEALHKRLDPAQGLELIDPSIAP
jgi:predicted DNA-binding protein with PD1-like motif